MSQYADDSFLYMFQQTFSLLRDYGVALLVYQWQVSFYGWLSYKLETYSHIQTKKRAGAVPKMNKQ